MYYYVNSDTGSDLNPGTEVAPWKTLQHALTNIPNGSVLFCTGDFREANPTLSSKSNITILPNGNFEINGFVRLDPVTASPPFYTFTPPGNVMIGGLAANYVDTQRFNDRPQCFLPRAATLLEAQTTENRWWQDPTTKLVTFTPHASQPDPTDPESDWCWFRTGNGFRINGCDNVMAKGYKQYGWIGGNTTTGLPDVATGYATLVNGQSKRVHIEGVEARGFGGHCFGGVDDVFAITFKSCIGRTGRRDANATVFVLHSDSASVGPEVLTMMRCISCVAHCDGLLDCTGAPADAGAIQGFFTHGGGAIFPRDVEFNSCDVYVYDDTSCRYPLGGGRSDQDVEFDEWDWRSYPIRYVNCRVFNGSHQQVAPSAQDQIANVAYSRCYISLYKNSLAPVETYGFNTEGVGHIMLESCVVIGSDNDLDTAGYRLVHVGNNEVKLLGINTAFININPNEAAAQRIFYLMNGASNKISTRQCLFCHITANSQFIANAATWSTSRADILQNWYFRITSPTGYCNGLASVDSQAEWSSVVDTDPESKYAVDPQLITSDLQNIVPQPGGALVTTKIVNPTPIHTRMGINGRAYSNNFGPWQWGEPGVTAFNMSFTTISTTSPTPRVLTDGIMYVVYDGSVIDRVEFNSPFDGNKVIVRPIQGYSIFHTGDRVTLDKACAEDPMARYWIREGRIYWAS